MSRGPSEDPFAELYGEFRDRLRGDRWHPEVDVFETDKAVVVRVEISGVRGEDIRVSVDSDVLRISGVRSVPTGEIHKILNLVICRFLVFYLSSALK